MQNSLSNVGIKSRLRQVAVFVVLVLIVALISKVIEIRSERKNAATVHSN